MSQQTIGAYLRLYLKNRRKKELMQQRVKPMIALPNLPQESRSKTLGMHQLLKKNNYINYHSVNDIFLQPLIERHHVPSSLHPNAALLIFLFNFLHFIPLKDGYSGLSLRSEFQFISMREFWSNEQRLGNLNEGQQNE